MEIVGALDTDQETACGRLYSDHEVMAVDDTAAPSPVVVNAHAGQVGTCIGPAMVNASLVCQGTVRGVSMEEETFSLLGGMKQDWTAPVCARCPPPAPFQCQVAAGVGEMVAEGDCDWTDCLFARPS